MVNCPFDPYPADARAWQQQIGDRQTYSGSNGDGPIWRRRAGSQRLANQPAERNLGDRKAGGALRSWQAATTAAGRVRAGRSERAFEAGNNGAGSKPGDITRRTITTPRGNSRIATGNKTVTTIAAAACTGGTPKMTTFVSIPGVR